MADPALNIPRISAKEYLEMERDNACKHEFVDGIVYMMAGASRRHPPGHPVRGPAPPGA